MVRGQRQALQLVRRGSLLSAGARSPYRRELGFCVSSEELPRNEAKHAESTNEISSSCRISKLVSRNGDIQAVGAFNILEGRQWLGFQKRGIFSSEQAMKASDEEKAGLVSQSDNNVGGHGQPPPTQPLEGDLMPTSEEEDKIAPILGRSDLLITRNVEWANLALGFEQQNKYVIMDPLEPQAPVGYIVEESNVILRQVMRTRRPFVVSVLDANGEEVCRVRRPPFFINSSMFIEVNGKIIGECHGKWHLWKRIYDVYIGNKQFATVENPGLWNWTFTLADDSGGVLAVIDRNWRGFGFEFLTDAGQYMVRFGDVLPKGSIHHPVPTAEGVDRKPFLLSKNETTGAAEVHQLQEAAEQVDALAVARPLKLTERAVVLALAVSLDNDYFSRHSQHGIGMPLPFPFPYYSSGAAAAEDSPAGSSNTESESGHEVFPRQGFQGTQSENTAGDGEVANDTRADDPYHGIFDEPGGSGQNTPDSETDGKWGKVFDDSPEPDSGSDSKWGQFFDDTPDSDSGSGGGWGLGDWGVGSDS
ncbi:hypothetical protein KC19_1G218700 [Ceratodon purpureus]|uniref:Phospholipid scramblase n=1 Tax=Ceratodon purpureus TaxID=3225 RepID=A0A8T0JA70_CERPU|nr:hypothetical protein KC19_1G218700 [Ceratodon purpureus]